MRRLLFFFEKENELGGILRSCCIVPTKTKMKWYMIWLRRQIEKLGVTVNLRTEAKIEDLREYDAVLCGTGAETVIPNIPGAEKGIRFNDILICQNKKCPYWPEEGKKEPAPVGEQIVIWGDHYAAADTAEAMGLKGKKITIITENKEFGQDLEPVHKEVMKRRFQMKNGYGLKGIPYKYPVDVLTETTILEVKDHEVICIGKDLKQFAVPCETLIYCKTKENTRLFDSLKAAGLNVVNMGDSKKVRNVRGAMTDGTNAGLVIEDGMFMNANGCLTTPLPLDCR